LECVLRKKVGTYIEKRIVGYVSFHTGTYSYYVSYSRTIPIANRSLKGEGRRSRNAAKKNNRRRRRCVHTRFITMHTTEGNLRVYSFISFFVNNTMYVASTLK